MRTTVLAGFTAIVVAGCAGAASTVAPGASTTASSPPVEASQAVSGPAFTGDPCSLLTDAEITQITKQPIVSKTVGQQLGVFDIGCDWEVGPPNQVTWSVQLGVIPAGGRSYYDQYFAPFEGTPITGLGDEARERADNEVLAVHGDVLVGVTLIAPGNHDKTLADQLMQLVIARV
jgi:hypothetical protein